MGQVGDYRCPHTCALGTKTQIHIVQCDLYMVGKAKGKLQQNGRILWPRRALQMICAHLSLNHRCARMVR